jgi:hypothetical protein
MILEQINAYGSLPKSSVIFRREGGNEQAHIGLMILSAGICDMDQAIDLLPFSVHQVAR